MAKQQNSGMETKPFILDKSYYVVQSNSLIRAKQELSMLESRILSLCISQNMRHDTDFRTYSVRVPDLADFLGLSSSVLYRGLPQLCTSMMKRVIYVDKGEGRWAMFHWVSYISYNDGEFSIRLSEDLKPFLLNLESYYTQYKLQTILSFQSTYTIRLYQLLKCNLGASQGMKENWTFTLDQLREIFQIGEKYPNTRDLLKNTLYVATDELTRSPYAYFFQLKENRARKRGAPVASISIGVVLFENGHEKQTYLNYMGITIKDKNGQDICFDKNADKLFAEKSDDIDVFVGSNNEELKASQLRFF